MDAFYASVEQRDRPELRGRPVIVGADPRGRGVVSAASYEARRFGVHSAMPIGRAARLCPDGVFLPVDMDKYARVSRQIMAVLAEFTPLLEPLSIDEAFLDVTESRALLGDGVDAGAAHQVAHPGRGGPHGVRRRGFQQVHRQGGVRPRASPTASSWWPPGTEAAFLAPLPMSRLWGVGKVTASELESMGIRTIGQLAALPRLAPRPPASAGAAPSLLRARSRTRRPPRRAVRSAQVHGRGGDLRRAITATSTRLRATLRGQAERVARELRAEGFAGRTVTLKLRFADFSTITRRHTAEPTQDGLSDLPGGERASRPRRPPSAGEAHRALRF